MAGEQTAKVYEALVAYCAKSAIDSGALPGWSVEREVLLPAVSIKTDVLLYGADGGPAAAFFVTHSNSEVDWHKKFERDAAEFIEHTMSDQPVGSISLVIFDSSTLPGLETSASLLFTKIIRVNALDENQSLEKLGHDVAFCAAISRANTIDEAQHVIDSHKKREHVAEALIALEDEVVKAAYSSEQHNLSAPYFDAVRSFIGNRSAKSMRDIRHTRVNRAISKLAMFDVVERGVISQGKAIEGDYSWACAPLFWPVPDSKSGKGPFLRKILGGRYRCVDPEVIGGQVGNSKNGYHISTIFDDFDVSRIGQIIEHGGQPMLGRYMNRIRLSNLVLPRALEYIAANFESLKLPGKLSELFLEIQEDTDLSFKHYCDPTFSQSVTWHWAYSAIVSLVKAVSGKKQGYGYSKIARGMTTPRYKSAVQHSVLQHLEYGLRSLEADLVSEAAGSIAIALQYLSPDIVRQKASDAVRYFVWSEYEDKLIPHGVDVLRAIIEIAAIDQGLDFLRLPIPSCLSEATNAGGTAGHTYMYVIKNTLIWHKSVHYRQNVRHKRKEIQTAILTSRIKWEENDSSFSVNKAYKKAILVIDGDWLEEDLIILRRYGWDEFLYPHELTRLSELIV